MVARTTDPHRDPAAFSEAGDLSPESEIYEDELTDESSKDEENNGAQSNSYGQLLRSLEVSLPENVPSKKRRKLNTGGAEQLERRHDAINGRSGSTPAIKSPAGSVHENDADDVAGNSEDSQSEIGSVSAEANNDPFDIHFANPDTRVVKEKVKDIKDNKWSSRSSTFPNGYKQQFSDPGEAPSPLITIQEVKDLSIRTRHVQGAQKIWGRLGNVERGVAGSIFGYKDLLFVARSIENSGQLRDMTMLHAVNHVLKTRSRVLRHNARLAQNNSIEDVEYRDQGFTRPKVLILLPTRQACVRFVDSMLNICRPAQQENKSRFMEAFSQTDSEPWEDKPEDFQQLFGGNDDDMFRIGIKFTRKTVKLFSEFYQSDILLASPLGLRTAIEKAADQKASKAEPNADFLSSVELVIVDHANALLMQNWLHVDFLFAQLNLEPKESHGCDFSRVRHWCLNGEAKYYRQTIVLSDFLTPEINSLYTKKMLNWNGKTKLTPPYTGAIVDVINNIALLPSGNNMGGISQTFIRINSPDPSSDADVRFSTFVSTILPSALRSTSGKTRRPRHSSTQNAGILVFIPVYHDLVRLRNHLSTSTLFSHLSFATLSEYASVSDASRARSHFQSGRHSILLYSERAHHFRRYRIRGVKQVLFYGVPENPLFWGEIAGLLGLRARNNVRDSDGDRVGSTATNQVKSLFSRWDVLKLERIVGSDRVGKMFGKGDGVGDAVDTFNFT